jgi:heavy metal sensor kinase
MRLWPDSVRWRLTLWYSLALAAMLGTFAATSLFGLARLLSSRTDHFLEEARDSFATELAVEYGEVRDTDRAVKAAIRDMRFRDVVFLLYDAEHRLIAMSRDSSTPASPAADSVPLLDLTALHAQLAAADPAVSRTFTVPDSEGGHRVATQPLVLGGVRHTLAAAQSRHALRETIALVILAYLIAIPILLALAAVGGYFLAGRALAPVAAMSRRAREISATNLHERLPVQNPRDELGELALMINELLGRFEGFFDQQRRFVADASHELRTPVAIVRAESEISLERETRPEGEYRESLRVVHDAGQRLSRIVDDLFLLARADSGHQPLRRETLYLDELTSDIVRSMRAIASRRSIRLEMDVLSEATFHGDPRLLDRMLLNLVDNAVKYSPAGSVVEIRLSRAGSVYLLAVSDSGPGIPPEARTQIFDRFFRVDKARSRAESSSTSGAGLGLAIARWVAEAHGGSLDLRRSGATGSEFVVTLPISETSAAGPAQPSGEPADAGAAVDVVAS